MNNDVVWSSIATHEGSVQHLEFLTEHEKDVFKTAYEVDQRWVIEHAADRTPYICQAQSVNLFMPGDVHKRDLHYIHFLAWKKGMKSLYYCRSTSIQRAEKVSQKVQADANVSHNPSASESTIQGTVATAAYLAEYAAKERVRFEAIGYEAAQAAAKYDECLACQ